MNQAEKINRKKNMVPLALVGLMGLPRERFLNPMPRFSFAASPKLPLQDSEFLKRKKKNRIKAKCARLARRIQRRHRK